MGKTYIFIYYVPAVIVFTTARRHIFDSQHLNLEFIEMQRSFGEVAPSRRRAECFIMTARQEQVRVFSPAGDGEEG